jgi:hypothetical protein
MATVSLRHSYLGLETAEINRGQWLISGMNPQDHYYYSSATTACRLARSVAVCVDRPKFGRTEFDYKLRWIFFSFWKFIRSKCSSIIWHVFRVRRIPNCCIASCSLVQLSTPNQPETIKLLAIQRYFRMGSEPILRPLLMEYSAIEHHSGIRTCDNRRVLWMMKDRRQWNTARQADSVSYSGSSDCSVAAASELYKCQITIASLVISDSKPIRRQWNFTRSRKKTSLMVHLHTGVYAVMPSSIGAVCWPSVK